MQQHALDTETLTAKNREYLFKNDAVHTNTLVFIIYTISDIIAIIFYLNFNIHTCTQTA